MKSITRNYNRIIQYECAKCHGVFEQPIENYQGFIEAIKLAASLGRTKPGQKFDIDKVPTVNACCPDCFQHFK